MSSEESLRPMIESEFFTMDLLLAYLVKYRSSAGVLRLLIAKLKTYERPLIKKHLNELIFYSLQSGCTELDQYFLQLCAEDFNLFFLITNAFEIWGYQFTSVSAEAKKRVRSVLEDCETAMVNGEKPVLADQQSGLSEAGRAELDQIALYSFVIGKRTKNDLKDDVRYFVSYLVKLSYLLLGEDRGKIRKIAVDFLHKLNLELYARRAKADDCM